MNKTHRVLRGGSFVVGLEFTRSASRDRYSPHNRDVVNGFRVVANGVVREATRRVLRGGSFCGNREYVRCAIHSNCGTDYRLCLGFRVVMNRVERETARPVVRGGSFRNTRGYFRCASHHWNSPVDLSRGRGFRVVVTSKTEAKE